MTPEQERKLKIIADQVSPGFLTATKDTGHEWQRNAATGAVTCKLCGTDGKDKDAALARCVRA